MKESATPERRRGLMVALAVWWLLLALQVWYAWDLNEVYAGIWPLLLIGPETPFALVGLVLGLRGLAASVRHRALLGVGARVLTIVASAWLIIDPPVMWLGASLHVWRHEDRYLAEIAAARASMSAGAAGSSLPDRDEIFVEGQPPRFGFEQRWTGMFHWAAFVFDPDRTLEAMAKPRTVFGYSMLGYDHLWGDWYIVWAMK